VHVAVIMDGNRRWARERGLPVIEGYRRGVAALRETIAACPDLGVDALTVYGFSAENWHRDGSEVAMLMELCAFVARREAGPLRRKNVQVRIIGDVEAFPENVRKALSRLVHETAHNTGTILNLALNYGGRQEIAAAVRAIAIDVRDGKITPDQIDETLISAHLSTAGLEDPDLLIRTGGEFRVSNFLLYQIAYAELFVSSVHWPDFTAAHFAQALSHFSQRTRRFGA